VKRLPLTVDDLRGVRAARWVRESTPGQFDRYGPEAQLELQDRAIGRLGLVDTGLIWRAAHSGRTVYRSAEMAAMLAAAERGAFDVLLVGYVSRWQRNLHRTLELLEDKLHPVGVPVYFADEEILSSAERDWDQLVGEAQDAERTSRRLSRRIREGYAGKLAKQRDPGGHPPFGFRRNSAKLLEPDPALVPLVVRIYELAATGLPDAAVSQQTRVGLYTIRGVLTSPLYAGRLRDSAPAHWEPLVPQSMWEAVRTTRAHRATNTGRKADPRRPYALGMLHCASCGKRLTGDTGYYRHREPCPAFVEARPVAARTRGRWNGHAYRKELYEEIVEGLLREIALGAGSMTRVVGALNASESTPDRRELDRIERERARATAAYLRDRDTARLETRMQELDRAAEATRSPRGAETVPADVAVRYLRDLPATWKAAEAGPGRQMVASALFSRIEVLGLQQATVHLTDHAVRHGIAAALPGEVGISVSGRGERI
jgi:DNA invertase Pin-like site-specific DNA recombinase